MTIKSLLSVIGKANIVGDLDEDQRRKIADRVIEREAQDWESMKDWRLSVEKGIELCAPEWEGKTEPYPNASNYKTTVLAEAANDFGNRASLELLRDNDLVKAAIIGAQTIKNVIDAKSSDLQKLQAQIDEISAGLAQLPPEDPQAQEIQGQLEELQAEAQKRDDIIKQKSQELRKRNERADRVAEYMNWQTKNQMEEWRHNQRRMLYTLPNMGTMFKKTYYDQTLGRPVSQIIKYPDFSVNQATVNLKTCRSFTHIVPFTKAEAELRMRRGMWVDAKLYDDADTVDAKGNEDEEADSARNNPCSFFEQYCWEDLDGDGLEEPYIATVHVSSAQLVRLVARFDEQSVIVEGENIRPMPLLDAQRRLRQRIESDANEFGVEPEYPEPDDMSQFSIVRIEPIGVITKYGMIPSFDGSYLDLGFYHLIGAHAMGVNRTTNDLIDAGRMGNMQGGWLSKIFKSKQGIFKTLMGQWVQTEASPEQLQQGVLPFPYKEPSPTLFQLNEKLENTARAFYASFDPSQLTQNTAPTTALAMIQEAMTQHSAHLAMIIESMSHEFGILFDINRAHLDEEDYRDIVGDDEAVFSEDFSTDGLHISCGASPEHASKMQRMVLAEAEMAQVPLVLQAGGNPIPIIRNYYARIGSENLHEIFPNKAEMSPEDRQQMEAMRQQQEIANQLAEQQVQMIGLQTELLKAREDRADREFEVKRVDMLAEIDKKIEQIQQIKADVILTLEQAESEAVKNALSIYTTRSAELTAAQEALDAPEIDNEA